MSDKAELANTPEPPYYAVIFTSQRTDDDRGYGAMAERMVTRASEQPGFLGVETVRGNRRIRHYRIVLEERDGDREAEGAF
jgi:hypothetical protein